MFVYIDDFMNGIKHHKIYRKNYILNIIFFKDTDVIK